MYAVSTDGENNDHVMITSHASTLLGDGVSLRDSVRVTIIPTKGVLQKRIMHVQHITVLYDTLGCP